MRYGRILAAVLGATLALMAHRGCDDADATEFIASCVIASHDAFDFNGTAFYQLSCGKEQGAFLVSVDADLPIAKWLDQRKAQRISLSLGGKQ